MFEKEEKFVEKLYWKRAKNLNFKKLPSTSIAEHH